MAKGKYHKWRTPEGLTLIGGWARNGLTDAQIAHNMGITRSTLSAYKKRYTDINDTLKKNKEVVDFEVENALLEAAKAGNPTAIIFWLKNRKPKDWRDKQEIQHSGEMGLTLEDHLNQVEEPNGEEY